MRRWTVLTLPNAWIRSGLAKCVRFQTILFGRLEKAKPCLWPYGRPRDCREVLFTDQPKANPIHNLGRLWEEWITSNDCAYQSCTFLIDGMSLSPSGSSPSSCTLWARRMGSSSARNCDARKSVPDWCTDEPRPRYSTFDYMYLLMVFRQTGPFDGGLHLSLEKRSNAWWFPSASRMPSTP